jgi:nitrite reductase/ring-hydroxylating ferredoxin subunit
MAILPAGTVVARMDQLIDGAGHGFDLTDEDWPLGGFVVRIGTDVHAYLNRCPHAGRRLSTFDRFLNSDGTLLQCMAHGALFEKSTGECVAGPCLGEALKRIAVRVDAGAVCLAEALDVDALARSPW